ncbi:MAG: C40 family peptidase [Verrucomicrobia bacterium]|nr:C40 family peptidase [Verrucomicrobiota bacterium]
MHTPLRLLLVMLVAVGAGTPLLAATTSSKGKKSSKTPTSAKKTTPAKPKSDDTPAKSDASATATQKAPEPVNEDPATSVPTPAVVSTLSIADIRDFDSYPKQIQSLVQSCLALTHLDLGYLYGSHEPSKGGMDCSGTIYHVLHFQGLKDVPRQSDEMCNWVDKKSQLHLTPTAKDFDSEEFKDLKPGDLLFWTNSLETTRKLPVTHVMVYLGKLKKSGKRVVFGSSDGRSYMGERRSGVSVFDFTLPRPDSPKHFYGYGPTPGLLPPEPKPAEAEKPVIAAVTPAPAVKESPAAKDTAVVKASVTEPTAATPKTSPASQESPVSKTVASNEPAAAKETPAVKEEPPQPKEEVRKAVTLSTDAPETSTAAASDSKPEVKKTAVASADVKSTSSAKPKTSSTTKKRSATIASKPRRRTPAAPPKSVIEQKVERAVSSVRRFFQQ